MSSSTPREDRPTAVRFNLADAAVPAVETVAITDLLRRAGLARLGQRRQHRDRTHLGGRDQDSSMLQSQHVHGSSLPVIHQGVLRAIVVWAPGGFAADEVAALSSLRELRSGQLRVRLCQAGLGPVGQLAPHLVGSSRAWRSVTPYLPAHYPKRTPLSEFLPDDIARELGHRQLPAPPNVLLIGPAEGWRRARPSVPRSSPQGRPDRPATFLEISFAEPVIGPLALGHLSHFGLGLFRPSTGTA